MMFQLVIAACLGLIIGIEREHIGKAAGKRTFSLVALGAALYTIISENGFMMVPKPNSFDPSRVVSQIVVGIGFLGAGLIVFQGEKVKGLTTAAALWVAAAVGAAIGLKFYIIGIFVTFMVFFILAGLRRMVREE